MLTSALTPTIVSGGATILGALGLYGVRQPSPRALDAMLGGAAGVMLAAVAFSLLVPALEGQDALGGTGLAVALMLGALAIWALHRSLPHEHVLKGREGHDAAAIRRTTLLVVAVALHNIPEGLAVGVGMGNDAGGAGLSLAMGILIQNLPEGLAVAAALAALGTTRGTAIALSSLTAVVEIAAGVAGLALASVAALLMPTLLAAAAGAMLFVVSHEILPETHRYGNEETATLGLVVGFAAMLVLHAAVA